MNDWPYEADAGVAIEIVIAANSCPRLHLISSRSQPGLQPRWNRLPVELLFINAGFSCRSRNN